MIVGTYVMLGLRQVAVLICCILGASGAALAAETGALGLSRDDLLALATASGALGRDDFEVVTFASGESALLGGHSRFRIAAFGSADDIHTLRFDLLGDNARREDSAALDRIVANVMAHLFADWPEASSWPRNALDEASGGFRAAIERAREEADKPTDPRRRQPPLQGLDLFAFSQESERDGKWVAAFNWLMGHSYLITIHPACLPDRGRRYWKSLSLEHFQCFR